MNDLDALKSKLQKIIDNCNYAIAINEQSIDNPNKGYPYASGYSRAALQTVVVDVESILKHYLTE